MNNAFYGKTMENVRHRNLPPTFSSDEKELKKLFSKPNFKSFTSFDEYGMVLMNKPTTIFDKPIYIGMAVLDYSKLTMYDFYYEKKGLIIK